LNLLTNPEYRGRPDWTKGGVSQGSQDRGTNMDKNLLNIGFGNTVAAERVIAIVSPNSAPMKRLKDEAKDEKRLIDATHGRRTRSIIVMDSNHIVLSAIQAETISQRYTTLKGST
jgi:extracellular matrix regulatory protein A